MKLLHFLPLLILISALVLESEAWLRRRRRRDRRRTGWTICPAPPTLPYTYRSGCSSPYTHGQRCYYRCHPGYTQVSGSNSRTCSYTRWLGSNLVCRNDPTCSPPPTVAHTYVSGCSSPYTNWERCYYRCFSGYRQVSGSTVRTCSNGAWTGTDLVCSRASTCATPPFPAYTYRSGCSLPYTNGESCTYRCYSGYTQVSGSTTRTCSNGAWTGSDLVCRRASTCSTPPSPAYTSRSGCYSPYTNGERCYYRCYSGYTQVSGSTTRTCSNGAWAGTNLVCRSGTTCSTPPSPAYTYRSGCSSPYTNGERCYYRCYSGYTQVSGSTTRICSNRVWTGTDLVCRRGSTCSTPPTPAYTYRSGCSSPYTNGERCYYRCYSGYTEVKGSNVRTCSNGAWTGYILVCRRVGCSAPPTLAYTYVTGCSYPYTNGERCYYRCRSGYTQVSGSTTRICSNGRWTGTNLICRRGYWEIDRR